MTSLSTVLLSLVFTSLLCFTGSARAEMYKCNDAGGKTVYADKPCNGNPNAKPWKPKAPLNVVSSESLTGTKKSESAEKRPSWLKPIDPIGDCKRKGGKIDPELRACIVP
jgi:Domain of unknown function (DUF4124)